MSGDEYIFTLPVPPSANRYWRVWNNRIVVTDEARAYKDEIALLLRACIPLEGDVSVNFTVFRPRMKGDLDNSYRKDDKVNPRVEILISRPEGFE
jgi:Holliday junction resolvase RusA-like endonuclease